MQILEENFKRYLACASKVQIVNGICFINKVCVELGPPNCLSKITRFRMSRLSL